MASRTFVGPDDLDLTVADRSDGTLLITWGDVRFKRPAPAGDWSSWSDVVLWDLAFTLPPAEKLVYLVQIRRADWMEELLRLGSRTRKYYEASLNSPATGGLTPLFWATLDNYPAGAGVLAAAGADPRMAESPTPFYYKWTGWSPLNLAITWHRDPLLFDALLNFQGFSYADMVGIREVLSSRMNADRRHQREYMEMMDVVDEYRDTRDWRPFPAVAPPASASSPAHRRRP